MNPEKMRAALEGLANYGTRHDLNPTLGGRIKLDEPFTMYEYMKSMDEYVRIRARKALED